MNFRTFKTNLQQGENQNAGNLLAAGVVFAGKRRELSGVTVMFCILRGVRVTQVRHLSELIQSYVYIQDFCISLFVNVI